MPSRPHGGLLEVSNSINGDDALEQMILDGLVEVSGVDSDGQFLYSFTPKMIEEYPAVARVSDDLFVADIHRLWELGFVVMNIDDPNPMVSLSELAFDKDAVEALSEELRLMLNILKNAMRL